MTKILMVCLGNICRSPLAEGILQFKVDATKVQVDSAAMEGYHIGELPDKRSIKVAGENLIDITDQKARLFTIKDFENYDLIYAMDKLVFNKIIEKAPTAKDKDKVMLLLNEVFPGEGLDVPDPYHDSIYAFRNVYRMIDEACGIIAKKII
jgi:protein-tyrosine phosphatase